MVKQSKSIDTALKFTHYASFISDTQLLFSILLLIPLVGSGLAFLLGVEAKIAFVKLALATLIPSFVFITLWRIMVKRYLVSHGVLIAMLGSLVVTISLLTAQFFTGEMLSKESLAITLPLVLIVTFYGALLLSNNTKHALLTSLVISSFFSVALLGRSGISYRELSYDFILASMFVAGVGFLGLQIVNAPLKKQYGISIMNVASSFFSNWFYESKGFEEIIDKIGKKTLTLIGGLRVGNGKEKALITIPYFHFGPFGNVGSSRFPSYLAKKVENSMTIHGTATHDFNLTSKSEVKKAINAIMEGKGKKSSLFSYSEARYGKAKASLLSFGDSCICLLSRAPETTEDIAFSAGLVLMESLKSEFKLPLVGDCHNSSAKRITRFTTQSNEFWEYYNAVKKLKKREEKELIFGFAKKELDNNTIDKGGVSVAVFEGNGKVILVSIDTNGIKNKSRESIEKMGKERGYATIVCTTDTHGKNAVEGAVNDCDISKKDEKEIAKLMDKAIATKSRASAETFLVKSELKVLGEHQLSEIIATINSTWAVTKLVMPTTLLLILIGFFLLF